MDKTSKRNMDDNRYDFVQWLGQDMSLKILMCLEDPSDLVRTSVVSSSWRNLVIDNGLCKKLCLKMFPETSCFARFIEIKDTDDHMEREHTIYASINRGLTAFPNKSCIRDSVSASSTDNYPEERIRNTLEPSDIVDDTHSYWSSGGTSKPDMSETLIYRLDSQLCLISEIHIQPFQAYFQDRFPIYSAKAVRFWMGHRKIPSGKIDFRELSKSSDDNFVWTCISPEFPMAQENRLQKFELPEPALCIGGTLKVELLGRVQTQDTDGLYYICITHVRAVGKTLSPLFEVDINDQQGKCTLKHNRYNILNLLHVVGNIV